MRALLLIGALALSACGTVPASQYAAENNSQCVMSNAREHASCVHAAGAKRTVAQAQAAQAGAAN